MWPANTPYNTQGGNERHSHFCVASGRREQRTNIVGTAQHHSGDGQIGGRHAWWSRARALREAITERNLIRRTGASAQLGDLVGDLHTATWIVCSNEMPDNDELVVWTKRGSRQGCPLGGIAFNLMYE